MCKPSLIFSKTTTPTSTFPTFAFKNRDFRVNFCVNNGSVSMASCVPIYKAETLDRQLDEVSFILTSNVFIPKFPQMTSLMLSETIEIDAKKRVVTLPKLCSSYLQDFASKSTKSSHVSPIDCLRVIVTYLNRSDRHEVVKMLSEGSVPSVKFKNVNYSCRRFELYQQAVIDED